MEGKLDKSLRYAYDGYWYHDDKGCNRNPDIKRCATRSTNDCKGVIFVDPDTGDVILTHAHDATDHPRDPLACKKARFRNELLRQAEDVTRDFKRIFDDLCLAPEWYVLAQLRKFLKNSSSQRSWKFSAFRLDVSKEVRFTSVRSIMQRRRESKAPSIPKEFDKLHPLLENYTPLGGFYRGEAVGQDGSRGFIFIDPKMDSLLKGATDLHMDGTFKVVYCYSRCLLINCRFGK